MIYFRGKLECVTQKEEKQFISISKCQKGIFPGHWPRERPGSYDVVRSWWKRHKLSTNMEGNLVIAFLCVSLVYLVTAGTAVLSGGSKSTRDGRPHPWVQFSLYSCRLQGKLAKILGWRSHPKASAHPVGNTESATGLLKTLTTPGIRSFFRSHVVSI